MSKLATRKQPLVDGGSGHISAIRRVRCRATTSSGAMRRQPGARAGKKCPILSGAISGKQGLKCPYLAEILDTGRRVFYYFSITWRVLKPGLKIRVSGVQFPPWPPMKSIFQIKKLHQTAWTLRLTISAGVQYFGPLLA